VLTVPTLHPRNNWSEGLLIVGPTRPLLVAEPLWFPATDGARLIGNPERVMNAVHHS